MGPSSFVCSASRPSSERRSMLGRSRYDTLHCIQLREHSPLQHSRRERKEQGFQYHWTRRHTFSPSPTTVTISKELTGVELDITILKYFLTSAKDACTAGDRRINETIVPRNNMTPYINLVEVEFRHVGHDRQHNPHAAVPQQQASYEQKK